MPSLRSGIIVRGPLTPRVLLRYKTVSNLDIIQMSSIFNFYIVSIEYSVFGEGFQT